MRRYDERGSMRRYDERGSMRRYDERGSMRRIVDGRRAPHAHLTNWPIREVNSTYK